MKKDKFKRGFFKQPPPSNAHHRIFCLSFCLPYPLPKSLLLCCCLYHKETSTAKHVCEKKLSSTASNPGVSQFFLPMSKCSFFLQEKTRSGQSSGQAGGRLGKSRLEGTRGLQQGGSCSLLRNALAASCVSHYIGLASFEVGEWRGKLSVLLFCKLWLTHIHWTCVTHHGIWVTAFRLVSWQKKHVPSKRPKSGFARTKAILMILMLIVQSNRSGRSYFGCLRNPNLGGGGSSVHILSTNLILYTFNTRSRLNYFCIWSSRPVCAFFFCKVVILFS